MQNLKYLGYKGNKKNISKHREEPYSTSMIIYNDKNKIERESEDEENLIPYKNADKYFNRKDNFFG